MKKEIWYIKNDKRESFIVFGETIDEIRKKTIKYLQSIGVNTDMNDWGEVVEETKYIDNKK